MNTLTILERNFPRVYSNKEDTRIHTRKYLGAVIEIETHKYYIPLSSPKDKHDYIMVGGKKTIRKDSLIVMRIVAGTGEKKELKGTLQIGTMIPVPDEALELYDVGMNQIRHTRILSTKRSFIFVKTRRR